MSGNAQFSTTARNAMADAVAALLNGGSIKLYDGTQPATANTAISTQNLLATFTLANPAFGASSSGVATANAISNVSVAASGKATWFRALKSDGTTAVMDGSIGAGSTVTLGADAAASATSITVSALTFPVYQGTILLFYGLTGFVLATVTADAAINATTLSVSALSAAIKSGATASFSLIMNASQLVLGATASISSFTLTAPAQGL